ncbi:Oncoprotein-induced transcript 3 protein [Mactra antiquata]
MKQIFTSVLCLTLLSLLLEGNAFDPCVDYEVFSQTSLGSRNEICQRPNDPRDRLCDYRLASNWYFIPQNGSLINSCPVVGNCSTDFPVWLNGTLPIESDGIVNRTCCIKVLEECCKYHITIQVKNCSNMIVYYLPALSFCDSVYCIDTDLPCKQTTTAHSTTTTTTPQSTTTTTTQSTAGITFGMHEDANVESEDKTNVLFGVCVGLGVLLCVVTGVAIYFMYSSNKCKKQSPKVYIYEVPSHYKCDEIKPPSTPPPPYSVKPTY